MGATAASIALLMHYRYCKQAANLQNPAHLEKERFPAGNQGNCAKVRHSGPTIGHLKGKSFPSRCH
jgi:hypothetical protein